MRGPESSKQRVWLGSGQYRDSRRDATANSDSVAKWYADTCADSMRTGDANSNAYCNCDSNCHPHAERNSVTVPDTDRNGNSDNYAYGDAQSYAKAAADPASSAVSAMREALKS